MAVVRSIYKVARSILFSAVVLVAIVFIALYLVCSNPGMQKRARELAQREASAFLGAKVEIGDFAFMPFNEARLSDVRVFTPDGRRCVDIATLGAGINLWRLLTDRKIEITYVELVGLDASLWQARDGDPLNIDFIIKAFAPKQKNRPPARFDLKLHNVVVRRCKVSFDKWWKPSVSDSRKIDFNHLRVSDIKADIYLPRIANDNFEVDLRRLSLNVDSIFYLDNLQLKAHLTNHSLSVRDLEAQLPATTISPADFNLTFNGYKDIPEALKRGSHSLVLVDNPVSPADFRAFFPPLAQWSQTVSLSLDVSGNLDEVDIDNIGILSDGLRVEAAASLSGLLHRENLKINLDDLRLKASSSFLSSVLDLIPSTGAHISRYVDAVGNLSLEAAGHADMAERAADADCRIGTSSGEVSISGSTHWQGKDIAFSGMAETEALDLSGLPSLGDFGSVSFSVEGEGSVISGDFNGNVALSVPQMVYRGRPITNIEVNAGKADRDVTASFRIDDPSAVMHADLAAVIDGVNSVAKASVGVSRFIPSDFGLATAYSNYVAAVDVDVDLKGNSLSNMTGKATVSDFDFSRPGSPSLHVNDMTLTSDVNYDGTYIYGVKSDFLNGTIHGRFDFPSLGSDLKWMLAQCIPALFDTRRDADVPGTMAQLNLTVYPDEGLADFFHLPVSPLVPLQITGVFDTSLGAASLTASLPYMRQGSNKLVRDISLKANIDASKGVTGLKASTIYPAKKGDIKIDLGVYGKYNDVMADIGLQSVSGPKVEGKLSLDFNIDRRQGLTGAPDVRVGVVPSELNIGNAVWKIAPAAISCRGNVISIDNLRMWHDSQLVDISGVASPSPADTVDIRLHDFDLDYLFDTLNINYVTFGGRATGHIAGSSLLSRAPHAATRFLHVDSLSYNGTVLGNGDLSSSWDNEAKEVKIRADIADVSGRGGRRALVDGGVWIGRDSLSFDIDANKVDVGFMKPFMSAFTSDVGGRASGHVKLFGTFSDIDLTGRIFADSIGMKVDYTNVYYHGSDSVFIEPGKIIIPDFRLYDRYGNSAILNGVVGHRYFHEPTFTFKVSEARNLLCYDTNATLNPDWYGRVFGSGGGMLRGVPGLVTIDIDMATRRNSTFTFVLNDTQAADDYKFLSFSDRRAEARMVAEADSTRDFTALFRKQIQQASEDVPSNFRLGIRATVTPQAELNIIMDPIGGDKITARGSGAMQIDYDADNDQMLMYGKYVLDEGKYNFSLQDIILKDFTIRHGSSISFNGDPLRAMLDITALYRVNTNLTDLDKSFSTDKDLNRTNVPVDAVLKVTGEMTSPDISFDIDLPTLTEDVERKVKSIISTDDMMSRQIIYLLALNRFYTPEYMGGGSNGGELASVASSTLSSQLSNMLGRLTDKFTLSPAFRSDKGDFSDLEFDVALSSRLLNNRLLINGNFGYRDRSTSSTTLVGDFDIEYLLSRSGNLRLKAYNHFNDQNYYLRSSLTTQGIGIIYRRDFNNPFTFLKKRKKKAASSKNAADSTDSKK